MVINLNNQISYKPGLRLSSFWNQSLALVSQCVGGGSGDFLLLRRQGGCPEDLSAWCSLSERRGDRAPCVCKESPTWKQLPDWEYTYIPLPLLTLKIYPASPCQRYWDSHFQVPQSLPLPALLPHCHCGSAGCDNMEMGQ